MRFTKVKEVKPFVLWVQDIEAFLGVPRSEAWDIAHETWTRPEMEKERDRRKAWCQKIKTDLREGYDVEYGGAGYLYVPFFISHEYQGQMKARWAAVQSERECGIGRDLSDWDHFEQISGGP